MIKSINICIVIFFSFVTINYKLINHSHNSIKVINNNDSILAERLKEQTTVFFIGKSVDEYLKIGSVSKFKKYTFFDEPPGILSFLSLSYNKFFYIDIYAKISNPILKKLNSNENWDINLFRKEKITRIKIYYKGVVIKEVKSTPLAHSMSKTKF